MKQISKFELNRVWVMILGLILGSWSFSQAQTTVCAGDSVCLDAGSFRGTIQWQDSPDGITFTDIAGFNTSPYCDVPPTGQLWIRGAISEGTCDTFYTDTTILNVTSMSASFSTSVLQLNNCAGSIALGDSNLVVSGGTMPYSYVWSPSANLSSATAANPIFTATTGGSNPFTVVVTDSIGCSATAMVTVDVSTTGVDSFTYTGAMQTYTVPSCVDTIFIEAWGAEGGSGALGGGNSAGGLGGLGGYASGYYAVTPGMMLNIYVGGAGATPAGGFNGGGTGGTINAGGGGGASDVRFGGTAEANRIITAGGGGGGGRGACDEGSATVSGGGGAGSAGGSGLAGGPGYDAPTSSGVAGGGFGGNNGNVQGAAGAAGIGCGGYLGSPGVAASTGTGGNGGNGQTCCCTANPSVPGGGGGGGGQVGGGGGGGGSAGTTSCSGNSKGAGGGGGGGSSSAAGVVNGTTTAGLRSGNGFIRISW